MNYRKKLKQYQQKDYKRLINKFSILNASKYFSAGIFQNYLVFIPAKKYTKLLALLGLIPENQMKFQNKILKI